MPIHEGFVAEHELTTKHAASSGAAEDYPGHEHDNDGIDWMPQEWHPRMAEGAQRPWDTHVPAALEGQDAVGGHQAVDITITLFQPQAGARLDQSAVQQALPRDYQRLECRILAVDGPVLMAASKEQAEQAYSAATTTAGANPVPGQPAVPATGVAAQNVNAYPVQVVISANGATITNVSVNGLTVGSAAGTYVVPAYGSISIAYTVATPTWVWSDANPVPASTQPPFTAAAAWLPQGLDRVRRNCDELWIALPGSGAATTHVSIMVSRRLSVEPATLA